MSGIFKEDLVLTPAHHIAYMLNGKEVVAHGPPGGTLESLVAAQEVLVPGGLQPGDWREVDEDYVPVNTPFPSEEYFAALKQIELKYDSPNEGAKEGITYALKQAYLAKQAALTGAETRLRNNTATQEEVDGIKAEIEAIAEQIEAAEAQKTLELDALKREYGVLYA